MAVIFMKLYGYYKPYDDISDDVLQEMAQYQVFFTLFGYVFPVCEGCVCLMGRVCLWDTGD